MKKDLISVVMSAYNSEKFISDSISSILDQTYENWELIIINDASSDNTLKIVNQFSEKDPRIKVIDNENNLGLTISLNIGINNSKGEFIARLDSDDFAEPSRLEKELDHLHAYPEAGLVGSGAHLINSSGNKIGSMNVMSQPYFVNRFLINLNPFIHSSIMVRKKALDNVGSYREKFRYSQDYDLILRLSDKYKLSNIALPLIRWRVSDSSVTMQHHTLQRIYADIAREFAIERRNSGHDSYESTEFDTLIHEMRIRNQGRYLCDHGVYDLLFNKKYKEGCSELIKGISKGGFPYNSFYRGITQVISKVNIQ
ncbi:glycosyltransferase family 2 protein [Methanosarcina mazei]|jgi:glycosyltransferase involved in cell wall biosynthesis|uniref:Glycosyltransferase n=11 Tax=Methanosarcina TaxID=2207 RepID=A0A0F8L0C5_METMZ|nr:glycosyltransferase [Methanosarcina mazei]AAM30837.1 glycosyltransferase [Methanosarcina mazei Go1]AGF96576.1 glycosyl transferase, group 2 family protein [Methanosarcina mazei Tuc01]AKB39160.1 Glycosyl transferase, group 2 family protein [Methanosarcina mazei WWM610]AKB60154.1 Putative N-acetylgalactosaminyl-diphosphoundecaprenol glucuronosyltransferase [Methanosarcina mazei SarPi]AKB63357.1 Putative N-acetylgalactosaminyl-diphosphoundecaprenol glucuronosyltransferase [Methanosarcina mazei